MVVIHTDKKINTNKSEEKKTDCFRLCGTNECIISTSKLRSTLFLVKLLIPKRVFTYKISSVIVSDT